jgi:hypothetical protein
MCKNLAHRRVTCKACEGAGQVAVDRAIEIGMSISDTEREMLAVHPIDDGNHGERGP